MAIFSHVDNARAQKRPILRRLFLFGGAVRGEEKRVPVRALMFFCRSTAFLQRLQNEPIPTVWRAKRDALTGGFEFLRHVPTGDRRQS